MPNIDPKVSFYLGLALCVAAIIANGGDTLFAGAIPAAAITMLVAWAKIINGIGTGVMTYIAGTNMTNSGRIANVQQVPFDEKAKSIAGNDQVKSLVLKDQNLANSITSPKVVGPTGK